MSTTTRTNDDVKDEPHEYVCFGTIDPYEVLCRTCSDRQPCLSKSPLAGMILIGEDEREEP